MDKAKQGPSGVIGQCEAWGCRRSSKSLDFCPEHYDHFKFGLIRRTGERALDYDKKLAQYTRSLTKQRERKAA
jgi:hypothetical protein